MTLNELTDLLPTLTGGVLAIGLVLFLLALRLFRRGRKATMWQNRRQAGKRGFRMMLTAIGFLGLSAMLCITTVIFKSLDGDEANTATPLAAVATTASTASPTQTSTNTIPATNIATATTTPTATLENTLTEIVTTEAASSNGASDSTTPTFENTSTATSSPSTTTTATITVTPSATSTPTGTATNSPSPTPSLSASSTMMPTATVTITPFPTLPSNITPPVAQATPAENISMRVAAISDGLTADFQPLSPRGNFETGVSRLYFFLRYRNMNEGILWRPTLFKDGEYLDSGAYLWGLQTEGESYFFFGQSSGFEAGAYEIRIYIGDAADPLVTESFTIQ